MLSGQWTSSHGLLKNFTTSVTCIQTVVGTRLRKCTCTGTKLLTETRTTEMTKIQSNLDNSNADFSKLPDFSKTSDGPEIFLYCLLLNYYRFFEFRFFEKFSFFEQFCRSRSKKFLPKPPLKFEAANCQSKSRTMNMISL